MDSGDKTACFIVTIVLVFLGYLITIGDHASERIKSINDCVQTTGKILECNQLYSK